MSYTIPQNLRSKKIPETQDIAKEILNVTAILGIDLTNYGFEENLSNEVGTNAGRIALRTPITGQSYGTIAATSNEEYEKAITQADSLFAQYKIIPAPQRGEFVRVLGNLLREYKNELGFIVSVEAGKIVSEGLGEVQEMIDIADFSVGLSRQLYGKTIASERPGHTMRETWHPIGPVGVITAFNFPVAVWAWNSCISFVCGNPVIFKPSDKTSVSSIVIHELARRAAKQTGIDENISQLIVGGVEPAVKLAEDERIALLSVTGSVAAGVALAPKVSQRFGKSLLELGGNNAMIVAPSADLDLAIRAITFSAAGTAGQRCTTLRRLIVHKSLKDKLIEKLEFIYDSLVVGNPLCDEVLVGPLIEKKSHETLINVQQSLGVTTRRELEDQAPEAYYHRPSISFVDKGNDILNQETFAPLLHVVEYEELQEAIEINNSVPQGLSSCIFTNDVREAELFLSSAGSDCGIANVNIGPSGAEIGGAFGGEKHTGGGRESGSDSWRAYMRRATNTVNYSSDLPLAQGVEFPV